MVKGFIFDMDGTVIDSTASDYKAWQRALNELGVNMPYEEFISLLGAKGSEIVAKYIELSKEETTALLEKKEKFFKEISAAEGLKSIAGVEPFLQYLNDQKIPAALATGAGTTKLDFVFEKLPIKKYFKTVLTSADVHKGKPDPEIFLKAAEKLGLPPESCVVVEDAVFGIQAAKNAGMRCIALVSTNGPEALTQADMIFNNYAELPGRLKTIME